MMFTVNDVLDKIERINIILDLYETEDYDKVNHDDVEELLGDYRAELLNKKIAK